jgi:hypothetical protein
VTDVFQSRKVQSDALWSGKQMYPRIHNALETTKIERDLGVLIDEKLNVRAQVEAAAAANSKLGRLKKAFFAVVGLVCGALCTSLTSGHINQ